MARVVFDAGSWNERDLAVRLAGIFDGRGFEPYQKPNGSWVLDAGNNWFMHQTRDGNDLTYRYELEQPVVEALAVVLTEIVGVRRARAEP